MLRIRLSRVGRRNLNVFRIVVADKNAPIKGRVIEILGMYNPRDEKDNLKINKERVNYWISVGAKPTDTVTNLLVDAKILPEKDKIKKTTKKKTREKEEKIEKPDVIESPGAPKAVQQGSILEEPEEEKKEEGEKPKEISEESKPVEKEIAPEAKNKGESKKEEKS